MPSTHEPVHLLEPSDLLEPLDLSDRQADLLYRSTGAEPAATSPRGFTRAGRGTSAQRPADSERRSPLKSILMVAGALACFGAGTSLPQFQSFMRGDVGATVGVGQPSPVADVIAKSEVAAKPDAAKSDEAKPADASSATPSSNEPKADTALNATGTALPAANSADRSGSAVDRAAQSTPVPSAPVANDAVANQRPCPKGDANCLEGGAPSSAKNLTNADGTAARLTGPARPAQPVRQAATAAQPVRRAASAQDSERVEPRASNGQEASNGQQQQEASNGQDERAQSSRRTKATPHRERADQRSVARRDPATVGRSSRAQDDTRASESHWDFASDVTWTSAGRWQNRDGRRERDGWGERVVDDDVPPARFSGRKQNLERAANWRQDRPSEDRWEERNVDRTSNRRRDRSEENSRDDRRGKAGREDDFVMGRAERNDGPLMIFPPARYQW
jgi:hypothetical protein